MPLPSYMMLGTDPDASPSAAETEFINVARETLDKAKKLLGSGFLTQADASAAHSLTVLGLAKKQTRNKELRSEIRKLESVAKSIQESVVTGKFHSKFDHDVLSFGFMVRPGIDRPDIATRILQKARVYLNLANDSFRTGDHERANNKLSLSLFALRTARKITRDKKVLSEIQRTQTIADLFKLDSGLPGVSASLRIFRESAEEEEEEEEEMTGLAQIRTKSVLLKAKKTILDKFIKDATLAKATSMLKLSWSQLQEAEAQGPTGPWVLVGLNSHFATVLAMAAYKENPELAMRIVRTARKFIAFAGLHTTNIYPADVLDGATLSG